MNSKRSQIIFSSITGFLAVTIGAFGAHILESKLNAEMMKTFETGVLYHLVHSAVLLAISLSNRNLIKSFWFIFAGIVLFSFSLYLYSITGISSLALITPFGGVSFLTGWILIIYETIKTNSK